jgi:GntR family transcriptional regulator
MAESTASAYNPAIFRERIRMSGTGTAAFAYRPLYIQVKDSLIRRLIDGQWQPGQMIPSETDLAREIGVSQGTIRKALDVMTAENLLVRRQGRGTYVAEPAESRMLFQYFRMIPDSGEPSFPDSRILARSREKADATERSELGLASGASVWRIERIRDVAGAPAIVETISLSAVRFADFDRLTGIPNNVYRLYSEKWGITIARARERLKAVAASPADATALGCRPGTPLLRINRVAFDLEGNAVERRVSRCLTATLHYLSELR